MRRHSSAPATGSENTATKVLRCVLFTRNDIE